MRTRFEFFRQPEYVFLVLAGFFGMLFLVLTPPFQSPDENRHFYRAYHISLGHPFPTKMDSRVGGFIPDDVKMSILPFFEMRGKKNIKTTRKTIVAELKRAQKKEFVFVDFPASSVYTPVSYLPQAIGIRFVRFFSDSAILALYAGRLMTLICWLIALFFAIRITPIFKWLVVALALLPMSLFIHVSLNADMMTNAAIFLFIAFVFKQAFLAEKHTRKSFLVLALLVFWIASAKFLYTPLLLLFLIIPTKKFSSKWQMAARFGGLCLVAIATMVLWPLVQGVGYVSYADYNVEYREYVNLLSCANVKDQTAYILGHGVYIFEVIWRSITHAFGAMSIGYIGTFGWGEFSMPTFWVVFAYAGLGLIALNDGNSNVVLRRIDRFIFLMPFLTTFVLVVVSQLLIWTCVGDDIIGNLQGRYFIPIVPLLFFLFYRNKPKHQAYLPVATIVFSSVLLTVSAYLMYDRFFVPIEFERTTIFCDHEKGTGTSDFGTSDPNSFAGNGISRSDEKARSGKFSSKVSSTCPYGTIVSFMQCNSQDFIEMEAWQFGSSGVFVASNKDGKKLFQTSVPELNPPKNKWHKVTFKVEVPESIENEKISCYVGFFNGVDSCYFDDIKITYHRRK